MIRSLHDVHCRACGWRGQVARAWRESTICPMCCGTAEPVEAPALPLIIQHVDTTAEGTEMWSVFACNARIASIAESPDGASFAVLTVSDQRLGRFETAEKAANAVAAAFREWVMQAGLMPTPEADALVRALARAEGRPGGDDVGPSARDGAEPPP